VSTTIHHTLSTESSRREGRWASRGIFIDKNFAINIKRTKSPLRDITAADASRHGFVTVAQAKAKDLLCAIPLLTCRQLTHPKSISSSEKRLRLTSDLPKALSTMGYEALSYAL
jgi:hypothetical protein